MHFSYDRRPPRLVGMTENARLVPFRPAAWDENAGLIPFRPAAWDAAAVHRPAQLPGVATMLASGVSNQVGAAVGAHAFPAIGPVGVTAVRQFVAAAVLLPVARPDFRRFTRAQWWPTIALGLVFATMNLSLYTAVDRIGLGLAVTLEFLGPLGVAIGQSRTRPGPAVRGDRLCRRLGAGVARAVQRLPRARPGRAGGRLLGRVHPAQPAARQPAAGLCRRRPRRRRCRRCSTCRLR